MKRKNIMCLIKEIYDGGSWFEYQIAEVLDNVDKDLKDKLEGYVFQTKEWDSRFELKKELILEVELEFVGEENFNIGW